MLDIRCPAIQQDLPHTMNDHDGVVVFGGPMSANDDSTLPFIHAELEAIAAVLNSGKPFLGICLGAQMLARVLGAKVMPHPEGRKEIGYASIQPLPAPENPFAELTHVYHWHKEGFEVPRSAVLLAAGKLFPNQAFRYSKNAYGVQFHPEITREMIDLWTTKAASQLSSPGAQSYPEQIQNHSRYAIAVEKWLKHFLEQWLNGAEPHN